MVMLPSNCSLCKLNGEYETKEGHLRNVVIQQSGHPVPSMMRWRFTIAKGKVIRIDCVCVNMYTNRYVILTAKTQVNGFVHQHTKHNRPNRKWIVDDSCHCTYTLYYRRWELKYWLLKHDHAE